MNKEIYINGGIGYDVTFEDMKPEFENANGQDIDMIIASPGGYVSEGLKIYNLIRDYKRKYPNAQIMAKLSGVVASMATYISSNPAIDLVAAEDNAVFMIHNASGITMGDYREMRKSAEISEKMTNMLAKAYVKKTGKDIDEIRKMMDDETYFFGQEIKDFGFADEIIATENEKDKEESFAIAKVEFENSLNKMSAKKENIDDLAAMLNIKEHKPASIVAEKNIITEDSMSLKKIIEDNPAAKNEYDAELKAKYEAGVNDGKEELNSKISKVANFLNNENYPSQIKNVALEVLKGEKSIETLDAMVATADMMIEMQKSNAAKNETETIGDVQRDESVQVSEDGQCKTEEDFQAEIRRAKQMNGLEVK